jgi:hypothetical protein
MERREQDMYKMCFTLCVVGWLVPRLDSKARVYLQDMYIYLTNDESEMIQKA